MALNVSAVNLTPCTHFLLAKAGHQRHAMTDIVMKALNTKDAFQNPDPVKSLSETVRKISLCRLPSFLAAFRKVLHETGLDKNMVTFIVLKEELKIPRALVIAFSHVWATNLCYRTQDQLTPITLLKPDEKSFFKPEIFKALLGYLKTGQRERTVDLKKLLCCADIYNVPAIQQEIHSLLPCKSAQDFWNGLNFPIM